MNNDKLTFCLKCDPKLLKQLQEAYDIIENDRKKSLKKFVDRYAKPLSINMETFGMDPPQDRLVE